MISPTSLPFFALVKIPVFDQTTAVFSDYRFDLELEGSETSKESIILNETFTPRPKEFKMSVTG